MTPPKRVWITLSDEAKEWVAERGEAGPFEYVFVPKKPKRKVTLRRSTD